MSRGKKPGRKVKGLNGAVGTPLAALVGGPICGIAFGAIMTVCNVAAEVSDKK